MTTTTTKMPMRPPVLLPGFHFKPKDHELINFFLRRKLNGEPPLSYPYMPELDVYGDQPSHIFSCLGEIEGRDDTERYAFTRLTNKGTANKMLKNRNRRVQNNHGFWKNERTDAVYYGKDSGGKGIVVGYRKLLTYKPNQKSKDGVNWIMHEFSSSTNNNADLVLCRIKRNLPNPKKKGTIFETASKKREVLPDNNDDDDPTITNMMTGEYEDDVIRENERPCLLVGEEDLSKWDMPIDASYDANGYLFMQPLQHHNMIDVEATAIRQQQDDDHDHDHALALGETNQRPLPLSDDEMDEILDQHFRKNLLSDHYPYTAR